MVSALLVFSDLNPIWSFFMSPEDKEDQRMGVTGLRSFVLVPPRTKCRAEPLLFFGDLFLDAVHRRPFLFLFLLSGVSWRRQFLFRLFLIFAPF